MTRNYTSCHTGSKTTYGKKILSVILAVMMIVGCFGVAAFAADGSDSSVITDVKIIRPFNKDFSAVKVYDKGIWEAYALADENGNALYFEHNPIHVGSVYRGYDKNVFDNGTNYYEWIGTGKDGGRNAIGERWDVDFPSSWNYDTVHASLAYTEKAYDENWNEIESPFKDVTELDGANDLMFMDHHLVLTEEHPWMLVGTQYGMYQIEEVYDNKIELNEGESFSVYFEPDTDASYSDLKLVFENSDIAAYNDGKIYGNEAGKTTATLTLKNSDGSTFTKTFNVVVDHVDDNSNNTTTSVKSFFKTITDFLNKIINFFKNLFNI